ncbi:hypothetical protein P5V15_012832 [Pogonomyrmex californicus]
MWQPALGDKVWKRLHLLSNKTDAVTAKLFPKFTEPLTVQKIILPIIFATSGENGTYTYRILSPRRPKTTPEASANLKLKTLPEIMPKCPMTILPAIKSPEKGKPPRTITMVKTMVIIMGIIDDSRNKSVEIKKHFGYKYTRSRQKSQTVSECENYYASERILPRISWIAAISRQSCHLRR